jgi:hypothetical protein
MALHVKMMSGELNTTNCTVSITIHIYSERNKSSQEEMVWSLRI